MQNCARYKITNTLDALLYMQGSISFEQADCREALRLSLRKQIIKVLVNVALALGMDKTIALKCMDAIQD